MTKRSSQNLNHFHLTTCKMGQFVPIMNKELLPGDTFKGCSNAFIRLSPLNTPVMHPVYVRLYTFFVPTRLIWDNFLDFITGGPDGLNDSQFPTIQAGDSGFGKGSIADKFGVNVTKPKNVVSALQFRAYNLIWNTYFRDQDLQPEVDISYEDGEDNVTNTKLLNVCWEKDRFTTCRPWTQKGAEVFLPLGTSAPVVGTGMALGLTDTVKNYALGGIAGGAGTLTCGTVMYGQPNGSTAFPFGSGPDQNKAIGVTTDPTKTGMITDLTQASAISVPDLRLASGLQRYRENRARFGSRYPEYTLQEFGVRPLDARIQWPELIATGKQIIQFSEVLQTAPNAEGSGGVGELYGHGISAVRTHRFKYFATEHGYLMTIMAIQPKTIYMQGNPREFNKRVKEDFLQPELQCIGQQEIEVQELYADTDEPTKVFGYNDRYNEYRHAESYVSGDFRDTLDTWHLGRKFENEPTLNADFVSSNPTPRVFQDQTGDTLWVEVHNKIRARRPLMKRAINVLK